MKRSFLLFVTLFLAVNVAAQTTSSDSESTDLTASAAKEEITDFGVKTPEKKKPKPFEEESESTTEVSVVYSQEWLSNGFGKWREGSINVIHKFSTRKVLYGSYVETERFQKRDRQANVGFYQPLDEKWTLLVEASASPTHRVLPKWSAMGQLERALGNGWIASAGYRRTELDSAKVNIGKAGFEKYWGLNRAAYSLSVINLEAAGTSASQRVTYNRYYGNESNFGIGFAIGKEVENIGNNSILQSNIRNISFSGKHVFTKNWGLIYGYSFHKQGDIYNRQGMNIGIRYKF